MECTKGTNKGSSPSTHRKPLHLSLLWHVEGMDPIVLAAAHLPGPDLLANLSSGVPSLPQLLFTSRLRKKEQWQGDDRSSGPGSSKTTERRRDYPSPG